MAQIKEEKNPISVWQYEHEQHGHECVMRNLNLLSKKVLEEGGKEAPHNFKVLDNNTTVQKDVCLSETTKS